MCIKRLGDGGGGGLNVVNVAHLIDHENKKCSKLKRDYCLALLIFLFSIPVIPKLLGPLVDRLNQCVLNCVPRNLNVFFQNIQENYLKKKNPT